MTTGKYGNLFAFLPAFSCRLIRHSENQQEGFAESQAEKRKQEGRLQMRDINCFIIWFIINWLSIIVHETGHLCAATLTGYTWREIQAGPAAVVRRGTELHLVFSKKWLSGRVMVEWKSRPHSVKRVAFIYAAGPIANLGLSALLVLLFCKFSPAQRDIYWLAPILVIVSLGHFAVSVVPFEVKRSGLKNDGFNLLNLWRQSLARKPS